MDAENKLNEKLEKLFNELKKVKSGMKKLEKRQAHFEEDDRHGDSAGYDTGETFYTRRDETTPECFYCGRWGHTEVSCWRVRCEFCSRKGHTVDVCRAYETYLRIRHLEEKLRIHYEGKDTNSRAKISKPEKVATIGVQSKTPPLLKKKPEMAEKKVGTGDKAESADLGCSKSKKTTEVQNLGRDTHEKKLEEAPKKMTEVLFSVDEDDDLVRMTCDFKDNMEDFRRELKEVKKNKDFQKLDEILYDIKSSTKKLKEKAHKHYKKSRGYEKWSQLEKNMDLFLEEIRTEKEKNSEVLKDKNKN